MNTAREVCGKYGRTHGMKHTRTYNLWQAMLSRTRYGKPGYADRGISVCDAWLKFENFYADMGDAPDGMSLDRIDNDGHYSPSNCRWATRQQQNTNKRSNVFIEWQGKRQTVREWEREFGMKPTTLRNRFRLGWPLEKAMRPLAEGNTPQPADELNQGETQ
jgi:hypothetical protein